jgi:hypothetical protein
MAVRRVFVIWANPIFRESVRLLLRHPDVEWVGELSITHMLGLIFNKIPGSSDIL